MRRLPQARQAFRHFGVRKEWYDGLAQVANPSSYAGAEDLTEEEVEAVDAGALPPVRGWTGFATDELQYSVLYTDSARVRRICGVVQVCSC